MTQLKKWAKEGIKSVDNFSVQHLRRIVWKTLEELNINYRQVFSEAGGPEYNYIPCVNDFPEFIRALLCLIQKTLLFK